MRIRFVHSTRQHNSATASSHPRTKARTTQITALSALIAALLLAPAAASGQGPAPRTNLPRTADGKPDLSGIWQVRNTAAFDLLDHAAKLHMPAGRAVVAGNDVPYQPWAAAKKIENFQNRATADPLSQCYMPGVPRIMYLD